GITPELSRLVTSDSSTAVQIKALDSLAAERKMTNVDFVKIDVEGEEKHVLEGAAQFLERESPLVMLEFWADKKFNTEIFAPLQRHGYSTFRLVPGINVLAPFYESEEPDPYQLNLFAYRARRSRQPIPADFLVAEPAIKQPAFNCEPALDRLFTMPFAQSVEPHWRTAAAQAARDGTMASHLHALRWFFAAQEKSNGAAARLWALEHAYLQLRSLIQSDFTAARAASFVRIAAAYGQRAEAIEMARRLVKAVTSAGDEAYAEPFLSPWPHQETLDAGMDMRGLLLASAIESYEHLFQFSSSDKASLAQEALDTRADVQYLSPGYLRRENLFKRRTPALLAAGT
ncbi:MAG TPA: FkbM family methyltransferase, partial [Burkholderiales bacterium]|nr:FkbM family methyltransferase [Burkholderiales bacterium]